MLPINAISGSTFLKTPSGHLQIRTQDGTVAYHGKADPEAVQAAFAEEHLQARIAIQDWLRSADVFGSGWHSVPMMAPQTCVTMKPRGIGPGRL